MGHPVEVPDELHQWSARQLGKSAAAAEHEAQVLVRRWRLAFEGLVARMTLAPLIPMKLSERMLLRGPRVAGEFADRRAAIEHGARIAVRAWLIERELDRADAERRVQALTEGTPAAGELVLPDQGLVLPTGPSDSPEAHAGLALPTGARHGR